MCLEKDCYLIETGYWIDKAKEIFKRNRIIPYRILNAIVRERKNTGVFNTVYRYNTENIDEAYLYGDMYFDFDDKLTFETVREDALKTLSYLKVVFRIMPEECEIYFSGNKGVHIMAPAKILGIQPDKNLNKIFRLIAENVRKYTPNKTLDLVIYDNKRLFRIPASIHETTGLYKIPITADELRNLTHDEIKSLAEKPRYFKYPDPKSNVYANARYKEIVKHYTEESTKKVTVKHKRTLTCIPPCIEHLLEVGATDGNRNNSIAVIASFHKNSGVEMSEALERVSEWNSTLNSPPTKQNELDKTVRSIYNGSKSYGCTTLKQVSECREDKCPLKKKGGKKNGR